MMVIVGGSIMICLFTVGKTFEKIYWKFRFAPIHEEGHLAGRVWTNNWSYVRYRSEELKTFVALSTISRSYSVTCRCWRACM